MVSIDNITFIFEHVFRRNIKLASTIDFRKLLQKKMQLNLKEKWNKGPK